MTTNFVTPPDFINDPNYSILLIDVDTVDIETLAIVCSNYQEEFNIYVYNDTMNDLAWLTKAVAVADSIIINTIENPLSYIKDPLTDLAKSYYYGPKNFLNNNRNYKSVFDFFVNRLHERNNQSTNSL